MCGEGENVGNAIAVQEAKALTEFWGPPGSSYHYAVISPESIDFHTLLSEGSLSAPDGEFFSFQTNDISCPTAVFDGKKRKTPINSSEPILLCLHLPQPDNIKESELPHPSSWHRSITVHGSNTLPTLKTKRIFASNIRAIVVNQDAESIKASLIGAATSFAKEAQHDRISEGIARHIAQKAAEKAGDIVVTEAGWRAYVGESNPFTSQEQLERNIALAHQERDPSVTGIVSQLEHAAAEAGRYIYKHGNLLASHLDLIENECNRVIRELFSSRQALRPWGNIPTAEGELEAIKETGERARVLHELAALLYWRKKGTHGFDSENFASDYGEKLKQIAEKYLLLKRCSQDHSLSFRGNETRRAVIAYSLMRELPAEEAYVQEKFTELLWWFNQRAENVGERTFGGKMIQIFVARLKEEFAQPFTGKIKKMEREKIIQQIIEFPQGIPTEDAKGIEFLTDLTAESLHCFSDATLILLLKTLLSVKKEK